MAAVAACSMMTSAGDAHAYVFRIMDRDAVNCGRDIEAAQSSTLSAYFAWTCESEVLAFDLVRRGKVNATGASYEKVTIGLGHSPSVASNGAVAFINVYDELVYAYDVNPGTGNCGQNAAFDCEVVPVSALGPGLVQEPAVAWINSKAYIVYRGGRHLRYVRRDGINNYVGPFTVYEPLEVQHYGSEPAIVGWPSSFGTNLVTAGIIHQVWDTFAKVGASYPCASNCYDLDALSYDGAGRVTALIDDRFYVRSGSVWSSESFSAAPTFATGLSDYLGYPRVTWGGAGGLRLSQKQSLNGGTWQTSVVDGTYAVGRSKLVTVGYDTQIIAYYDSSNNWLRLAVGN